MAAHMSKTYSDWFGRKVVLQIEAGESLVPLRGLVVNESNNALRFRVDGGWDVDIYKEMILRVEADNCEAFQLRNWEASHNAPDAAPSDSMPILGWSRVLCRDRLLILPASFAAIWDWCSARYLWVVACGRSSIR